MKEVTVKIPDAWVNDGVLFAVAPSGVLVTKVFDAGNKALEEGCYDERIGFKNVRPPYPRVWVDPAYVGTEHWPESAVCEQNVDGWVRLWRIDIEELGAPDDQQ